MVTKRFLRSSFIEFGPITAFFIGTELGNFYVGTALLVVGTLAALATSLTLDKRVPLFSVISSIFVLLFGGLTLYFVDAYWLVIEYTLYNAIFGVALLVGIALRKYYLKHMFESMFHISDYAWRILSLRWAFFFLLTAVLNEYIWAVYTEQTWIYFRVIAGIGLAIFGFSQFFLARRHRHPEASAWGLRI